MGAHNDEEGAKTNEGGANDGDDPVDLVVDRPAVDEHSHSNKRAEKDHEHKTVLG